MKWTIKNRWTGIIICKGHTQLSQLLAQNKANLSGADLFEAIGVNAYLVTALLILKDQPNLIRAYKLVNKKYEGPFNGGGFAIRRKKRMK